jgi:RNA-directed DNA polymerase
MRFTHNFSRWTRLVRVLCGFFAMYSNAVVARALSAAFLAGALDVDGCVDRGARLFGRRWRWLRPLARRVSDKFKNGTRPRQIEVVRFVQSDKGFLRATEEGALRLIDRFARPPPMSPVAAAALWEVPEICSPGELADWLGIAINDLDWFADLRHLTGKQGEDRLSHYHYRTMSKRFGQIRLIESPKNRLKDIQRQILTGILDRIPPHASVHGFRRGRSVKTFALPHTGKEVVLRIDLQDFFPSISSTRIPALFRTAGYPERVADLLAGLCTNSTPTDVWDTVAIQSTPEIVRQARWLYSRPHLPQGAPTSPALANLSAYRMDCRLSCLASSAGATYTRYADDLAFSGDRDFDRAVRRFQVHVCAIAMEEGFSVYHRKTRIMRRGVRQSLAGVVVNEHMNVIRADYDRLKATLTNCIRHGVQSQNRTKCEDFRAHLLGRIAFVDMLNPNRGSRLQALFERIEW